MRDLFDWRRDGAPEGNQSWARTLRCLARWATFAAICIALVVIVMVQAGGVIW